MLPVLALVLAARVMAPLGVKAADLVVWWEEGQAAEEDEAVRETIAAFEQETGKQVELVLGQQEKLVADLVAAVMMLPKTWRDPQSETLSTFVLAAVSGALAVGAVGAAGWHARARSP